MAASLPHRYDVSVAWEREAGLHLDAPPRPTIVGGPPPEFGGRAEQWSPEHLLLSSLGLCLHATFEAFARREKLGVLAYSGRIEGVLDKTPGGLAFTSLTQHVELRVDAGDVDKAARLIESAKRHCIVSNSLKPPVELVVSVIAAQPDTALAG
jgi:organic hydroperoxide reductase OsmC/OhrA